MADICPSSKSVQKKSKRNKKQKAHNSENTTDCPISVSHNFKNDNDIEAIQEDYSENQNNNCKGNNVEDARDIQKDGEKTKSFSKNINVDKNEAAIKGDEGEKDNVCEEKKLQNRLRSKKQKHQIGQNKSDYAKTEISRKQSIAVKRSYKEQEPDLNKQREKKNKKIKFDDDGNTRNDQINTVIKNHKYLNDDEAGIKDEDIDNYCDGLDEEDNKQYENWVKLLENNLYPKKNKA